MGFHITVVFSEDGVNGVVVSNGGQGLGSTDAVDNRVLGATVVRALDDMDVKMMLMFDGCPMDGIDGAELSAFVVKEDTIVGEGFLHLGEEISVNNGNFGGFFCRLRFEIEADSDLVGFVPDVSGRRTSQRRGSGGVVRRVGGWMAVGRACGKPLEVERHLGEGW